MRRTVRLLASLLAVGAAPKAAPERLYVVQCDGHVDVVATEDGERLRRVDLAATLPIERRQSVPGATFDNCLLNQAIYVSRQSAFYSLVPDRYSEPQRFDLWRFTVPGLAARRVRQGSEAAGDVPLLVSAPDGLVSVARTDTRPRSMALSGFASVKGDLRNDILERSGDAVQLRLYDPGERGVAVGVADTRRKALVRLQGLPPTFAGLAHLAPGGGIVFVEYATGTARNPVRSGRATLFDAATGRPLRDIADPRVRAMSFLAIVPSGKAVYVGDGRYAVAALGSRFPDVPVASARQTQAAYFVAPR